MTGMQVIDKGVIEPIQPESDGSLDYEKVKANYEEGSRMAVRDLRDGSEHHPLHAR